MPAVLKIDPQRRLVCSTFYGHVDGEELLRHRSAIAEDPAFKPSFSEIVDFSGVTNSAITPGVLHALSSAPSLFDTSVLHVIVAPGAFAELAQQYQGLTRQSRPNLVVVQSLREAYDLIEGR